MHISRCLPRTTQESFVVFITTPPSQGRDDSTIPAIIFITLGLNTDVASDAGTNFCFWWRSENDRSFSCWTLLAVVLLSTTTSLSQKQHFYDHLAAFCLHFPVFSEAFVCMCILFTHVCTRHSVTSDLLGGTI